MKSLGEGAVISKNKALRQDRARGLENKKGGQARMDFKGDSDSGEIPEMG